MITVNYSTTLYRGGGGIKEIRLIAEGRMGKLGKAAEYWKSEEEKICRLCREREETMRHIVEDCVRRANREGTIRD